MSHEQLKEEIKQIAEISASVPEQFREKCFELLLSNLINKQEHPKKESASQGASGTEKHEVDEEQKPPVPPSKGDRSTLPITAQLRLLMRKTSVTKEEIERILMYDGKDDGSVHFVKEPHDVKLAAGQIEWALLLALRNAVLKDSLSVDPEDVRSVCQEKGFYDSPNFASIFKRVNYAKLFKGPMVSQGEAQQLTNDGQDTLGKLIKHLAGAAQ